MIIRLRSKDGLERVEVPDTATVQELHAAVEAQLKVPAADQIFSRDQKLLLSSSDPSTFTDMKSRQKKLSDLGCRNGELIYMYYSIDRKVEPVVKVDPRAFGARMTVEDIAARQFRLERQDKPRAPAVSLDKYAANKFQEYVSGALAFSIKRGGIMYGSVDETSGEVFVEAIYEPPQQGSAKTLDLDLAAPEAERVELLARQLGLTRVGFIFAFDPRGRSYLFTDIEVEMLARLQNLIGPHCVACAVGLTDEGEVHFEAYQVSDQCCQLQKDGWMVLDTAAPRETMVLRSPKDPSDKSPIVLPSGKDVGEVDAEWFVLPVNIRDHEGPLRTAFPVENRLLGQGTEDLARILKAPQPRSYTEKLADFHLLLWLSNLLDMGTDVALLAEAVKLKQPIAEGYRYIIDSLAGI